jgi:predicted GNAT family acetyltransferase
MANGQDNKFDPSAPYYAAQPTKDEQPITPTFDPNQPYNNAPPKPPASGAWENFKNRMFEPVKMEEIEQIPGLQPNVVEELKQQGQASWQPTLRKIFGTEQGDAIREHIMLGFSPEVFARAAGKTLTDWYSPGMLAMSVPGRIAHGYQASAVAAENAGMIERAGKLANKARLAGAIGTASGVPFVAKQVNSLVDNWENMSPEERFAGVLGVAGGSILGGVGAHEAIKGQQMKTRIKAEAQKYAEPIATPEYPIRIYNGTSADVGNIEDLDARYSLPRATAGPGVYLSRDPQVASEYVKNTPGARVLGGVLKNTTTLFNAQQELPDAILKERGLPPGLSYIDALTAIRQESGSLEEAVPEIKSLQKELAKQGYHGVDNLYGDRDVISIFGNDVLPEGEKYKDLVKSGVPAKGGNFVAESAQRYNSANGNPEINHEAPPIDHDRVQRLAEEMDTHVHEPENPRVRDAYNALIRDVKAQWDHAIRDLHIKMKPSEEDPYKSYNEVKEDVLNNRRLKIFTGGNPLPPDHPLAAVDPQTGLTYNTMLRGVHDLFGHVAGDNDFSEEGEAGATDAHRQMMSTPSVPALLNETEGQVSQFFHGKGKGNFPEQKATIVPNEFLGRAISAVANKLAGEEHPLITVMKEKFGSTSSPKALLRPGASFLHEDGTVTSLGAIEHPLAIASAKGVGPFGTAADMDKAKFLDDTGSIRVRFRHEHGGDTLHISVPRDGVNEDQLSMLRQAVAQNKYGNFVLERSDITPETQGRFGRVVEFAKPLDLSNALREIGAHPEQRPHKSWIDNTLKEMDKHTAGAFDPNTGKEDTTGVGVEILPEARADREALQHKPTEEELMDFYTENKDLFHKHPELRIGWDKTDKGWELNIGAAGTRDGAIKVGNRLDQRAVWDIDNKEEIPLQGKGQQQEFRDYLLADRLRDLKGDVIKAAQQKEYIPASEYETEEYLGKRDEIASDIIQEYMGAVGKKGYRQEWDLVPAGRLTKIWNDYADLGFVRDEKGINSIADTVLDNIHKILVNSVLTGHSSELPSDLAEHAIGEILPDNFFSEHESFFDDEKGNWRLTDYAVKPLEESALEIMRAKTPEQKLQAVDRVLDIVHERSDLSSWFVEGGQKILNRLAGKEVIKPEAQKAIVERPSAPRGSSTDLLENPIPKTSEELSLFADKVHRGLTISGTAISDFQKTMGRWVRDVAGEITKPSAILKRSIKIAEDEINHWMMENGGEGLGWYKKMAGAAIDALKELHPELDDPTRQTIFKALWTAHSYGTKPTENIEQAERNFTNYEKTGKIAYDQGYTDPETGETKKWSGHSGNVYTLAKTQHLIDDLGEDGAARWLTEKHTWPEIKAEFEKAGLNVSKSGIPFFPDGTTYGSMAFGPKGGAFFLNLNGIHDFTTVDIWGARGLRRWEGRLGQEDTLTTDPKTGLVSDEPPEPDEIERYHNVIDTIGKKMGLDNGDVQALQWYYEHKLYEVHGVGEEARDYEKAAKEVAARRESGEKGGRKEGTINALDFIRKVTGGTAPGSGENVEEGGKVKGRGKNADTGELFTGHEKQLGREPGEEGPEEVIKPEQQKEATPRLKEIVSSTPWIDDEHTGYRKLEVKGKGFGNDIGEIQYSGEPGDENARIRKSFIEPGYRDQGIAKEMYRSAIEDAKARGVKVFKSDTMVSNDAQRVWNSLMREGKYPIEKVYTSNINANGVGGVEYHVDFSKSPKEVIKSQQQKELLDRLPKNKRYQGTVLADIHHELGHIIVGDAVGIPSLDGVRSDRHPDTSGVASMVSDYTKFGADENGDLPMENAAPIIDKILTQLMGGGAAEEILHGIPMKRNRGIEGDINQAHNALRVLGYSANEARSKIKAAQREAKKVLTKPGVSDTIKKYSAEREEGLPDTHHMSEARVNQLLEELHEQNKRENQGGEARTGNAPGRAGVAEGIRGEVDTGTEGGSPSGTRQETAQLKLPGFQKKKVEEPEFSRVPVGAGFLAGGGPKNVVPSAPKRKDLPPGAATLAGKTPREVPEIIDEAAKEFGIPPSILHAQARQESQLNPKAVNPRSGAKGVMQLMDPTAKELGVKDPFDPEENIPAGARYLRSLHRQFGHWDRALAAYDWGPDHLKDAIDQYGEKWLEHTPRETQDYVHKILKR